MKTYHFTTLLLLVGATLIAQSNRLTVDNSGLSSGPNLYADFATAHDAARNGDTIYIKGTSLNYGNLIVSKRLVILGPGYLLGENPNAPFASRANVRTISVVRTNDENPNSGGAGTEIRGITFDYDINDGILLYVNDVVIAQNYLYQLRIQNSVTSVIIIQNYILGTIGDIVHLNFLNHIGFTNLIFSNNIVFASSGSGASFELPENSVGTISHNLFLRNTFSVVSFNGPIQSNIAITTRSDGFDFTTTGNQVRNNTASNGQFGTDNGNNTAAAEDLFVGPTGNSTDGQYQLKATATAAKGTAHDGTDRGPFGGARPYILSGVPDLPVILYLELPATTRPTTPLEVTIRAASGN